MPALKPIASNTVSIGQSNPSGARNITFSESGVSLVQKRLSTAQMRNGNDAYDDLEGPRRI